MANPSRTSEKDTEDYDDDEEEDIPEETRDFIYDTSEQRNVQCASIRTIPVDDVFQIHDEIPQGEIIEPRRGRSSGLSNEPNRYGSII